MTQSIQELDMILGDQNERYFSSGFSKFNYQIHNYRFSAKKELTGSFRVQYKGPARPRNERPHLGSMEYTAMALFLAEGMLLAYLRLTDRELAMAVPYYLSLNIHAPLQLDTDTDIPFSCRVTNTENSLKAINIGLTTLEIKIANCDIRFVVDHPGPTQITTKTSSVWPSGFRWLHKDIYKERSLNINQLDINPIAETITAKLEHPESYQKKPWGISSSKNLLTPLDCVSVTGQLMQVLLYDILQTSRTICPNIWLRSMEIKFTSPYQLSSYMATVNFKSRRIITRKGKQWQLIDLSSELANMQGSFRICHQMPEI